MLGHRGKVTSLAAVGRGHCASGGADCTVRVWNCAAGTCVHIIKDHTNWVTTLVSLGNFRVASGSSDNTLRIWCAPPRLRPRARAGACRLCGWRVRARR